MAVHLSDSPKDLSNKLYFITIIIYDTDEMNLLNTSKALSIDRIRSSDEDTNDELQPLEVDLIRRRCTNALQLNHTEINFANNPLSEAEDSPTNIKHQHCDRPGSDPDFCSGRRPRK